MTESSTSIINHIPKFLSYCRDKGYSKYTQSNYKIYLQKFTLWLDDNKKRNLKPHELTVDDILAYKAYLSSSKHYRGQSLKDITQHYYLIALRALLSYFIAQDIDSLVPDKITLPRLNRSEKTTKLPNLNDIEQLLLAPDVKTRAGLRDRAILEAIISTGLKTNKLVNLDTDKLDELPKEVLSWIKKYLKTREDKNKALFINYKARKGSIGGRLTPRSIERIINYYGKKTGLPFSITPEILRWARPRALLDREIQIQTPHTHKNFLANNYYDGRNVVETNKTINQSLTWHIAENLIKDEILWLKKIIPVLPESYKINPPLFKCDDCILRKIAILIVSGKIEAGEIQSTGSKNLWDNITEKSAPLQISRHGQEWHKKMMDIIYDYFKTRGHKVIMEPILNYGRADLGIPLEHNKDIYVEIDTVSLFKLWYNLSVMKNATFLVIPSENKIIEFNTL